MQDENPNQCVALPQLKTAYKVQLFNYPINS
jgi:hypothetical protein